MARESDRKTPEQLLREVQAEEAAAGKGHLKIVLGYASGVGKSFRMLDEARRRRERRRWRRSWKSWRSYRSRR
jgi:two-component system sensor histidine kinase KdpD